MAGGYQVGIASETKAFKQGVDSGIIKPLEDAQKELIELGRSKGPDQLEQSMRDAQKLTQDLAEETKRTARAIETEYRKAGDSAKNGFDSVKDEARQSGAEAAASFSGEFTDIQDVAQETLANLGPAGIVGAVGIGAIAGVATAAVEAWNEKIQGIKDSTADMWQQAATEGQAFLDTSAIQAEAHRILWDDAYKAEIDAAEQAGVTRTDFAIALATGEGEIYNQVHQQLIAAEKEKQQEALRTQGVFRDNYDAQVFAEQQEANGVNASIDLLEEKAKAIDENKRKAADAASVTATLGEQERDQIQRTRDADQQRWEAYAKAREKAAAPIVVPIIPDDTAVRNYVPPRKQAVIEYKAQQTAWQ
ncbi:hypothetical protein AAIB33_16390 [Microbacterium sp. AZCO]|uniref:hypothetical protein n=1 Tax=Microbacterium sp. AZCO TaxID=3142976 RepID=UPI0031F440A8